MKQLFLFLLLASIVSAKEYRLLPPHIPAPKIVEAVPPPQTHVFAALDVNNAFTGNNTHSGTETFTGATTIGNGNSFAPFTFSNHNNTFWAGPGATPTIDQAKTACGALPGCIVNISPGYTGAEASTCVANSTGYFTDQSAANVVIHDYRALLPLSRCYYGFILGGRSFGAFTKLGSTGYWTGVLTDSTAAQSNLNFVDNATLPTNGGAMNGSVNVVLSSGSNNVGISNAPWVGSDGECDIQATTFDFPVNNCYGTNGQTNIIRTNGAQSIINAIGQHAAVNNNASSSGAQMINSYGTMNEAQSAGVGRNYSEYNKGNVLQDTETQIHSLITGANVTITAATESTQIATITTSGVCTFTTNQEVSITGVTPAAYNGRYFVRSPGCNGGNTFTYFHPSSASLGAGTVFGIVNGLTPTNTTYFRNTNRIDHAPLSDAQGWFWGTVAGSQAFLIRPNSLITSAIPHEFASRLILDEIAAPSGSATQDICYGDSTAHALECSYNNGAFGVVPLLNRAQTWTAAQTHTGAAIIPDQTSGITGTTTNNNVNAGGVGEYVQSVLATGSSVTLATGVTSNVTSISLTAGDWDVTGAVDFTFGATTSYTNLIGSVSSTSATIGGQDSKFDFETPAAVPTAVADATFPVPVVRFSLSGTTTVFLVAQGTFTVSTLKAYGTIRARRIR